MSVVPLTELKPHLNLLRSGDDAELQRKLDAAEGHVADLCGPVVAATETRTVTAHLSGDHLVLPMIRLVAVTTVRDPDGQTVTLSPGAVNLLSGIVGVPYRRPGAWAADVQVGRPLPPAVREAILIVAAHLWETQRSSSGGSGRPPGMGGDDGDGPRVPLGVLIPRRAEMLLQPHLLPPVIA